MITDKLSADKISIKSEAFFDSTRTHRLLWRRIWDKNKPLACVIMLNPCISDTIVSDLTSMLVVNNIANLERYGGVEILNIYSKITSKLNLRWDSDEELNHGDNDEYIKKSAEDCDIVILAWGSGAMMNKRVQKRIKAVLEELKPYSEKLYVITDGRGHRLIHPLTPIIRNAWNLQPFEASDIDPESKPKAVKPKITAIEAEENTEDCDDTLLPDDDAVQTTDNGDGDSGDDTDSEL